MLTAYSSHILRKTMITDSPNQWGGSILKALKTELVTPDLIKTYTDAYTEEVLRLQSEGDNTADKIERRLKKAIQEQTRLMTALKSGTLTEEILLPTNHREP